MDEKRACLSSMRCAKLPALSLALFFICSNSESIVCKQSKLKLQSISPYYRRRLSAQSDTLIYVSYIDSVYNNIDLLMVTSTIYPHRAATAVGECSYSCWRVLSLRKNSL